MNKYKELERKLQRVYGEHEGLLEKIVDGIVRYESDNNRASIKARLLTDEDVDKWLMWKEAAEDERLIVTPLKIGDKFWELSSMSNPEHVYPRYAHSLSHVIYCMERLGRLTFLTEEDGNKYINEIGASYGID